MPMWAIVASPQPLDIRLDDSSRQLDFLTDVNSRVLQRHAQTPHVCSAKVLGKAQLNIVDIAGMFELVGDL
jgi:hypothetical protein